MKMKRTITRKIISLLLALSLSTMILTGLVSAGCLYSMKEISLQSNLELGQTAAVDAEAALENMAGDQLLAAAEEKAVHIEEKFKEVEAYVHGIAALAQNIYANPVHYPDREVALPVKGSNVLAAQLLRSKNMAEPTAGQTAELLKLGNVQDLLVQYNGNNPMVASSYVATVSGWMIQADYIADSKYKEGSGTPLPYEAAERQWFQRALLAQEGQVVYSDIIEDVHVGGDCIVCAQPVYRNGNIVAVAGIGFYLETISEIALGTKIGESGYAFLVNGEGQIIASPDSEGEICRAALADIDLRMGENVPLADAVNQVLAGERGLTKITLDGRQVYLVYEPLESMDWGFMAVMDVEEVIAPAVAGQQQILALRETAAKELDSAIGAMLFGLAVILAVMAVIVGVAGMLFGRRVAQPIRALTDDVSKIGADNLDHQITIATGDEVEELGNAFNAMTKQLKTYLQNLASVTAEKERIRTELTVAARIQEDMLPDAKEFAGNAAFSIETSMTPAKEVGGDFYDFFLIDENRLAVIVADVSGKGVPAALFMVIAKNQLRSCIMSEESLEKAVAKANENLCANNRHGMFVTVWASVLNLADGTLTYVNAGHCRPLVKHARGKFEYLTELGGFVLAGMEGMEYRQSSVKLSPGDVLFQYTDGVVEANNTQGQFYGEERLQGFLNERKRKQETLIPSVWEDIQGFQNGAEQFDDITMLTLCYRGDSTEDTCTVPAKIEHLVEVRSFIEQKLEETGFPSRDGAKILVAVDEIFSNICHYSGAHMVETMCNVSEGQIEICFSDDGTPYNPLDRPDPDVSGSADTRPIGGLGIYIVKKTMDEVAYECWQKEGFNQLRIVKRRDNGGGKVKAHDEETVE